MLSRKPLATLALLLSLMFFLPACTTWRGIPTHGGGKRFDEEQLAVAGAIRTAVAEMNLAELTGKKVQVSIESLAHTGVGTVDFPSINSGNFNYNESDSRSYNTYDFLNAPDPEIYRGQYRDYILDNYRDAWSATFNVSPSMSYRSNYYSSDPDINYLSASLNMKAHHEGILLVGKTPDAHLYVLVDVLGTNRSRSSYFLLWFRDRLRAHCEVTYYAVKPNGQLLFPARRAASTADYSEAGPAGMAGLMIDRDQQVAVPFYLPVVRNGHALSHVSSQDIGPANYSLQALQADEPEVHARTTPQLDFLLQRIINQIRAGNYDQAQVLLDQLRAESPNYPGLKKADEFLQAERKTNGNHKKTQSSRPQANPSSLLETQPAAKVDEPIDPVEE